MSFRHLFYVLFAAFAVISCTDPNKIDPDEPKKENPKPGVYTFVLPDFGSKTSVTPAGKLAWEAGDEILVTGGYTPESIIVTLKASDISSDGKTATVSLDKVPESVYGPDDFYAAWPASAVKQEDMFTQDCFEFTTTDAPLMCAWLKDNSFEFHHICGAISFSISGDYDSCVLAGKNWQFVSYDSWGVEVNSESDDYVYRKGNSDYFLRKAISGGSVTMYFPNGINLSEGFDIYMCKNGIYPKIYRYDSGVKVSRGSILALGDISGKLSDYSGPAPELPQMPVLGKITRIDVGEVPELSGLCLTADGSALWTVGDNGWLGQISFDGKVTKFWTKSADMEGITLHPETGDLYIANEAYQVLRVKPPYDKPSSWDIPISVTEAKNYGNSGMEGISYYKDNMLFVGTQTNANVWLYNIDGTMVKGPVSLRKVYTGVKEVGGLCYDPVNDWLWVSDSEAHKIFVFDAELTHLLAQYPVPNIHNNESVCVDHKNNCVWVGLDDDDLCAIFKLEFTGLN